MSKYVRIDGLRPGDLCRMLDGDFVLVIAVIVPAGTDMRIVHELDGTGYHDHLCDRTGYREIVCRAKKLKKT